MRRAEMTWSSAIAVALDYGQFYLLTGGDYPGTDELVDEALDADGIAQRGDGVVIFSPHQNNFRMPLVVELWSAEPESDLADWEEAFEVHLDLGQEGLMYGSATTPTVKIDAPPGSYAALITGRGFVRIGWPGSTVPGDCWRIRLWPSDGPPRPRRLRRFIPAR